LFAKVRDENWKEVKDMRWVRAIQVWNLPQFFQDYGSHFTAKDLYSAWRYAPVIVPARRRGDKRKHRQAKSETKSQTIEVAKSILEKHGIQMPKTTSERTFLYKLIGEFLATKTFVSHTPDFLLKLPIIPGHDSKDQMMWRCQFDERITIPISSLPEKIKSVFSKSASTWVTVETHYRCNNIRYFLVPRDLFFKYSKDAKRVELENKGVFVPTVTQQTEGAPSPVLPADDGKVITDPDVITHCKYSCDEGSKKKKSATPTRNVWCTMECGLVLSAVSQWDLRIRSKNNKNGVNGWMCNHCSAFWNGKREGSHMLTLMDGEWGTENCTVLQVICGYPPQTDYNKWCKSRCEFYMRFEPNETLRDEPPKTTEKLASHRLRLEGGASDLLWSSVLSDPDGQLMSNLERLFEATKGPTFVKASDSK